MRSLVVRLLVLLVALLWAPTALAFEVKFDRDGAGHDTGYQYDISRSDCEANENIDFSLILDALPSGADRIELWVSEGSDCTTNDGRTQSNSTCVKADVEIDKKANAVAQVPASAIANALADVDECVDGSGVSAERPVSLFFLVFTSGVSEDVPPENVGKWTETAVDLVGPDPATIASTAPADTAFTVELNDTDFGGDVRRYQLYCDPRILPDEGGDGGSSSDGGGSATAAKPLGGVGGGVVIDGGGGAGGGVGGSGGAGGAAAGAGGSGGSGGSGDCSSEVLVAGAVPPTQYACGDSITDGASLTVKNAKNDRRYAVGVAAVDNLGNPGVLSPLECVAPLPVDDFFKVYNRAHGEGGCIGGCSSSGQQSAGLAAGLLLLGIVIVRRRRQALPRGGWLGLGALLALGAPAPAEAQSAIADNNWRHEHRPAPTPPDVDFAFEVRFAPYWAHVDEEPALNGETPYESTFGSDPTFYFGLEFDYLPIRIPYLGALGAGVGWGYTWNSAKARKSNCEVTEDDDCLSDDTTSLEIMPMHASIVLRADELMRRTGVPLVPYGKFGFGWAYWTASKTAGVSEIEKGKVGSDDNLFGQDVTVGLHAALGLALALNWLDARSAGALRESTGIAHMYLMAEWMNAMLTGFGGGQMRVGTSTFVTGLAADF